MSWLQKAIFFFNEPAHTIQSLPTIEKFPVPTPPIFEGADSVNRTCHTQNAGLSCSAHP